MTISPPEREAKKVKIVVDRNPVATNFEKWAKKDDPKANSGVESVAAEIEVWLSFI